MKYMYKQKSFSMVGVLMATVIFLLVSSVIVENMVFLIQTNNYKKYFLVGNYLANEGLETTKAILNRNIEQELASNTIDNPEEYTNANLRWRMTWDKGISPKTVDTSPVPITSYNTFRFTLGDTSSVIETGLTIDTNVTGATFGSSISAHYHNSPNYQLKTDINLGYIQGAGAGFTIYRQVDIIGTDYDITQTEPTGIDLDNDGANNEDFNSTNEIEVLSTVTLVDNKNRKYLYQVREKIPRPNLYN